MRWLKAALISHSQSWQSDWPAGSTVWLLHLLLASDQAGEGAYLSAVMTTVCGNFANLSLPFGCWSGMMSQ